MTVIAQLSEPYAGQMVNLELTGTANAACSCRWEVDV